MATPLEGARVLVVEDEYYIADDLSRALRSAGAEPVGPVPSIAEAEAALAASHVDAAIIDMNLHGTMAFDFAERLHRKRLPCVILSGYSEESLPPAIAGLPRLEKPVPYPTVLATLASELERRRSSAEKLALE